MSGTVSATTLDSAAIDLSANTSGVALTQSLTDYQKAVQAAEQAATGYTLAAAKTYAAITGDILTGSGNDLLAISTGKVTGSAYLGGGAYTVQLSGDAKWAGWRRSVLAGSLGTTAASFGGGSQFAITPDALKAGWLGEAAQRIERL